jgi:hypothetical protein
MRAMAEARQPDGVKLLCGLIAARESWLDRAGRELIARFGPADAVSETWPFDLTDYYAGEMGPSLRRRFLAFERLVGPETLVAAKRATNDIERQLAAELPDAPARPVNLDPGYLTQAKLVLASCKDFAHRVYLGEGVHAEVTLIYRRDGWRPLPWTFPDFATDRYHEFLTHCRGMLREQLRETTPS